MIVFYIILGIIISVIALVFFSYFFGAIFREWNEGEQYKKDGTKANNFKTLILGLIIFIIISFIMSKCN